MGKLILGLMVILTILVARVGWEARLHQDMPEALLYGLVFAVCVAFLFRQICIEVMGIQKAGLRQRLNAEQCRHLAVTLRTIGIGALIPVGLKIYGSVTPTWIVVIWGLIAIWLETLAVRILGNIQGEAEE